MSEILFLGTGAADWDIRNKGDFFRRYSAALVNRNLMLDCGAHIFDFAECSGCTELYNDVTDIIITHNHMDHFSKDSVLKLAENRKIRLGCDCEIHNIVGEHENIEFVVFSPYQATNMGDYQITPLLANHHIVINGDAFAFHYIIDCPDGKKLFYGLDGAWFLRPTWEEMLSHKFDAMVFDCTVGDMDDWRIFEHNTIPMLRFMVKEIHNRELTNEHCKLIASHIARTMHISHEDTSRVLDELGMLTAYDGMKVVF